jgi:palmitoyl-protein thioesterase
MLSYLPRCRFKSTFAFAFAFAFTFILALSLTPTARGQDAAYTPIVLYHGLGDNCCDEGMLRMISKLQEELPGVFVHSVRIGNSPEEDRKKTILDSANRQVEEVCEQLKGIPELSKGFNAVGMSQGGLLMRAYVERCNDPPVKRLITLGSPHQGVMAMPGCKETNAGLIDYSVPGNSTAEAPLTLQQLFSRREQVSASEWFRGSPVGQIFTFFQHLFDANYGAASSTDSGYRCDWWKKILQMGAYSPLVRSWVMQAQYFKDPRNMGPYYAYNDFLQDINADWLEAEKRNATYAVNLGSLEGFYLYMFEEDEIVVPRESSWFGLVDEGSGSEGRILYVAEQPALWDEDRLGLRSLYQNKRLFFRTVPGGHMQLRDDWVRGELVAILRGEDLGSASRLSAPGSPNGK